MSSESSDQKATVPKSKQERIRDNQRRSRARRQEYLAELERRLNECHITCRQAEIERSAFADLQSENARLRALLDFAGVSGDLVENFGRETVPQQSFSATNATFRHLKPKHSPVQLPRHQEDLTTLSKESCLPPYDSCSSFCGVPASVPSEYHQTLDNHGCYDFLTPQPLATGSQCQKANQSPAASYEWMTSSDEGISGSYRESFSCESFSVPLGDTHLSSEPDLVLDTVSRAMLNQYDPSPVEMEEIRARLAMLPGPSTLPEQNLQNNHVLLQILNEMNANPMHR